MPCPKCPEGILRDTLVEGGTESEMCDRCGYPHDDPGSREYGQGALPMGTEEQERILFD